MTYYDIKKGFCFLLCICVLFAVVTGCSSKKSGQAIIYNLEEEPVTLDPQIADDYSSRIVIMALYDPELHSVGKATPPIPLLLFI